MIGSQTLGAVSLGSVGAALSNTAGWTDARSVFGAPAGASLAFTSNVQIDGDASAWCFISTGATVSTVAGADSLQPFKAYPGASLSFKAKADRWARFVVEAPASVTFSGSRPYIFSVVAGGATRMAGRIGSAGVSSVSANSNGDFSSATGSCAVFTASCGAAVSAHGADGQAGASDISSPAAASFTARSDFEDIPPFDPSILCVLATSRTRRIEVLS